MKGAMKIRSRYSFREGCQRTWERSQKKSRKLFTETNYTGKLNPRGSFEKVYLSSHYKEEEKKGKRDELCTEHKDKLYFKNELLTRVFQYPVT